MEVQYCMETLRINKEEYYGERSNFWFGQWHDGFLPAAELMLAEAVGLVNTLDNWTVVDSIILSTKTPEKKRIFGKGNFQSLTGIVGVIHWVSVSNWSAWACFCCLLHQRKFGKRQESQLCLSTSSACLLCPWWVSVSCSLWLHTESISPPTESFTCTEGAEGSLGGQCFWQILSGPPHFPLQCTNERGQTTDFSCRDPLVKVNYPLRLLIIFLHLSSNYFY